jgi:hypothetical protein
MDSAILRGTTAASDSGGAGRELDAESLHYAEKG